MNRIIKWLLIGLMIATVVFTAVIVYYIVMICTGIIGGVFVSMLGA